MYKFGQRSLKHLEECDDRLTLIANKAIERMEEQGILGEIVAY